MQILREVKTRTAIYRLRDDGLIQQTVIAGVHQTLADADENIAAFQSLASPGKRPLLADMRVSFTADNETRARYSGDGAARACLAMAMLVKSVAGRMIGNFFLSLNRPAFPCQIFTNEEEALAWLQLQALNAKPK